MENRECQNCRNTFVIEPEDFVFYNKINVPPPTWCPECRYMRRIQWTNPRAWYPRTIDGKQTLSVYHPSTIMPVISIRKWWSDEWDAMDYGKDYDFSKPFFTQFAELYNQVPQMNMFQDLQSMNCDYCNDASTSKNCYFSTTIVESEDIYYSTAVVGAREIYDSTWMIKCELCYACIDANSSRGCLFSQDIDSCLDSAFLFDCKNCSDCIACINLRNKKFCVFNEQYTEKEYQAFAGEYLRGGYKKLTELKERFETFKLTQPHRHAYIIHCSNVTGDHVRGSKNCRNCFDITQDVEDCRYVIYAGLGLKDSYDCYNAGSVGNQMYEGLLVGSASSSVLFSANILYSCNDVQYSNMCSGSSNLFGCVGMKKKKYCILNKQYSKEDYEALAPKIIAHMNEMPYIDKAGRMYKYGEFFPAELSPFAHNETIANEYFPKTKEQAVAQGYNWREPEEKNYKISIMAGDLPDKIEDIQDSILNEIIGCEHEGRCEESCSKAFRLVKKELDFYRRMGLPLPHECPNCRYAGRFKKRNPPKLWPRTCTKCGKNIETSYAPNRPEIIYCESCYLAEVA